MEDGHKINRQARQSTMNQCNSPALRDMLPLPHSQSFTKSFLNTIPSCHRIKRSPQWHPQVGGWKTSHLATQFTSQLIHVFHPSHRDELTFIQINLQPRDCLKPHQLEQKRHLLLPRLTKNQSVISKQQVGDLDPFTSFAPYLTSR